MVGGAAGAADLGAGDVRVVEVVDPEAGGLGSSCSIVELKPLDGVDEGGDAGERDSESIPGVLGRFTGEGLGETRVTRSIDRSFDPRECSWRVSSGATLVSRDGRRLSLRDASPSKAAARVRRLRRARTRRERGTSKARSTWSGDGVKPPR